MKFGLLGDDEGLVRLARAAVAAGHQIPYLVDSGSLAEELSRVAPEANSATVWETLLDPQEVDGIVAGFAAGSDFRDEQLRKLVQGGAPLLIVHPLPAAALFCQELDMIRREVGGVLDYTYPGRHHPLLKELVEPLAATSGESVAVEQVVFERPLPERDKRSALAQLKRDLDLIAAVCGPQNKVAAFGPAVEDANFGNLNVQTSGPSGVSARWTIVPANAPQPAHLTVLLSHGRVVLQMPGDPADWSLELVTADRTETLSAENYEDAPATIARFVEAIEERALESPWAKAAQAVELAEAAEQSLRRGRTIELHFEEYSEQATFKGRMATLGCGLLMVAVCLLCLVGFLGDILLPVQVRRHWPLLIAIPLLLFVALQLLPKLFPERHEGEQSENAD